MFLNEVMEERRKICNSENGPIWATPENLPFLKYEIYLLFSYSYGSKVPKWKCAHILLCKKYKNSIKLLKIADLQPPDWIQRKKNTLYMLLLVTFVFCYTYRWENKPTIIIIIMTCPWHILMTLNCWTGSSTHPPTPTPASPSRVSSHLFQLPLTYFQ